MTFVKKKLRTKILFLGFVSLLSCFPALDSSSTPLTSLLNTQTPLQVELKIDWKKLKENQQKEVDMEKFDDLPALIRIKPLTGAPIQPAQVIERKVLVRPRGRDSLTDCIFPKLSIDFPKDAVPETSELLKGIKKFKLNPVCKETQTPEISMTGRRLWKDAPLREDFTYKILEDVGLENFETNVVALILTDTGANPIKIQNATSLPALILQTDGQFERENNLLQVKEIDPEAPLHLGQAYQDVDKIFFFSSFIGNTDFSLVRSSDDPKTALRIDRYSLGRLIEVVDATKPFDNLKAFFNQTSKKSVFTLYDFDLSNFVTAPTQNPAFHSSAGTTQSFYKVLTSPVLTLIEQNYFDIHARSLYHIGPNRYKAVLREFIAAAPKINARLKAYAQRASRFGLDSASFQKQLEAEITTSIRMAELLSKTSILSQSHKFFTSPDGKIDRAKCGELAANTLYAGIPVVRGEAVNGYLKLHVLDVFDGMGNYRDNSSDEESQKNCTRDPVYIKVK